MLSLIPALCRRAFPHRQQSSAESRKQAAPRHLVRRRPLPDSDIAFPALSFELLGIVMLLLFQMSSAPAVVSTGMSHRTKTVAVKTESLP